MIKQREGHWNPEPFLKEIPVVNVTVQQIHYRIFESSSCLKILGCSFKKWFVLLGLQKYEIFQNHTPKTCLWEFTFFL